MASNLRALAAAMPAFKNMMESRCNRGDLEKGIAYIQVNRGTRTPVGKFVEAGYQGSGDGMELVLIFEHLGRRNTIKEDMWGSTSGAELSYFMKDSRTG